MQSHKPLPIYSFLRTFSTHTRPRLINREFLAVVFFSEVLPGAASLSAWPNSSVYTSCRMDGPDAPDNGRFKDVLDLF